MVQASQHMYKTWYPGTPEMWGNKEPLQSLDWQRKGPDSDNLLPAIRAAEAKLQPGLVAGTWGCKKLQAVSA